jgi:Zn-dependent protease with chaperone function
VALLTASTGLWVAIWGAFFGAIIGMLAAGGVVGIYGRNLFNIGAGQAVTAVSVLAGAVLGAVTGLISVVSFFVLDRPFQAAVAIGSAALIGAIIVVTVAAFERLGLRMRGYRRLSRDEVRRLAPLVKDVAHECHINALPRFAMADNLIPNAWTHMRTVVLTTGLFQTLDDGELRGVLAHELYHWRMGDAVGLHCVWAVSWPLALAYDIGMVFAGRTHGKQSGDSPAPNSTPSRTLLAVIGWIIAWPAWVIIRLIIAPIVGASQRRYEYEADRQALLAGYGPQLSSALRKMSAFEGGRTGWEQAMTATHPATELRLEALEAPRPDDWEYQEDELRGPTGREVVRLLTPWRSAPPRRTSQSANPT